MTKYLSILFSTLLLVLVFLILYFLKQDKRSEPLLESYDIGTFDQQRRCAKQPNFLQKLKIPQPVAIDLSQQNHKGLAFLYGRNLKESLHLKTWEKFDHFSTYALDPKGNIYLSPMPFISIKENTFEFQKNIYKLDTNSGNLSIWMRLEEVKATETNPYGIIAVEYDCEEDTLWVSAIDETDYYQQRGVLYHIDVNTKKVLQKVEGVDALSLKLIKTHRGKYLLYGSAKESALFAMKLESKGLMSTAKKLFELSEANAHIRKIRLSQQNGLKVETIPFAYSLVAQSTSRMRNAYEYVWDKQEKTWKLIP